MQTIPYFGFTMDFSPDKYRTEKEAYRNYIDTKYMIERKIGKAIELAEKYKSDDKAYISNVYINGMLHPSYCIILNKVNEQYEFLLCKRDNNTFKQIKAVGEAFMRRISAETWSHLYTRIEHDCELKYIVPDAVVEKEIALNKTIESTEIAEIRDSKSFSPKDVYLLLDMLNDIKEDDVTYGHSARVGENLGRFAKELGFNNEDINSMRLAGYLHDIGKLFTDNKVINAPRRLNSIERAHIQNHSVKGAEFLKKLGAPENYQQIALLHHQPCNNYPISAERAEKIFSNSKTLQLAQMINIIDVFDARINKRQYHEGISADEIIKDLRNGFIEQGYETSMLDIFADGINNGIYDFSKDALAITEKWQRAESLCDSKYTSLELKEKYYEFKNIVNEREHDLIYTLKDMRVRNTIDIICCRFKEDIRYDIANALIAAHSVEKLDTLSFDEVKKLVVDCISKEIDTTKKACKQIQKSKKNNEMER